jgi:hypothetical protein
VSDDDNDNLVNRITRHGEEAIGRLAQELLEIPLINRSIAAALETRERAVRAQEVAMGALNLPSASDIERLTRRVRNVSQRLEAIEDGLDRIEHRAGAVPGAGARGDRDDAVTALSARLEAIEASLQRLEQRGPAAKPSEPANASGTARRSPGKPSAAGKQPTAGKPAAPARAPRRPRPQA